ncbi:hypothetical protein C8J57DRAFT_1278485 [Mycena rebaudengoi]|nr:hypothetical protein C8J57DRAFT_1278485 [Mycena rebaudengoi]
MKRGYLCRLNRQREEGRADESPPASGTVISEVYAAGGPLDSQTESQVYSIHAQSQPSSPVLSIHADDWKAGAKVASEFLYSHGIDFDFIEALSAPNVDFLCPNGVDYPGVSTKPDRSIVAEKSPTDSPAVPSSSSSIPVSEPQRDSSIDTSMSNEDSQPILPDDDVPNGSNRREPSQMP